MDRAAKEALVLRVLARKHDIETAAALGYLADVWKTAKVWRAEACSPNIPVRHLADSAIFWFNGDTLPAKRTAMLLEAILDGQDTE